MSEQHGDARALVEHMAKALVDAPDQIVVSEVDDEGVHVFELEVAESDMGKVIGKSGRTVRAMRAVLDAAGFKQNRDFDLDIID